LQLQWNPCPTSSRPSSPNNFSTSTGTYPSYPSPPR
jgi:hypothetical protein